MKPISLKRGNCLIYSILFWLYNPTAKIMMSWNAKWHTPSFSVVFDGVRYVYKPNDKLRYFTPIFQGSVKCIKINDHGTI